MYPDRHCKFVLTFLFAKKKSYRLLSITYIILPRKGYCMYLFTSDGYNAEHHSSSRSRLPQIVFGTIITILSALSLNSIQPGYSQSIDDFVGTWVHDPSTVTVTKVTVEKDSTGQPYRVHIFGKCNPGGPYDDYGNDIGPDCDWGAQPGTLEAGVIGAVFHHGGLAQYVQMRYQNSLLDIVVERQFPLSGRPNQISSNYLEKTDSFSISINPSSAAITAGDTVESTITLKLESGDVPLSVPLSCSTSPTTSSSSSVTCDIVPSRIDLGTSIGIPTNTAKLTIGTEPETMPTSYTAYITSSSYSAGGTPTALFELDLKERTGPSNYGGLSPTMLALIIGVAIAAVGGGAFVALKKRSARKADQSIP